MPSNNKHGDDKESHHSGRAYRNPDARMASVPFRLIENQSSSFFDVIAIVHIPVNWMSASPAGKTGILKVPSKIKASDVKRPQKPATTLPN